MAARQWCGWRTTAATVETGSPVGREGGELGEGEGERKGRGERGEGERRGERGKKEGFARRDVEFTCIECRTINDANFHR